MDEHKQAINNTLTTMGRFITYIIIFIVAQGAKIVAIELYNATTGESYLAFLIVLAGLINMMPDRK